LPEESLWGVSTALRLVLIGFALILERGRWGDFFLSSQNLKSALRDGLLLSGAFVAVGWFYALLTLGGVYWLPADEWLPTFIAALIPSGLVEELEFRALLLGLLTRWGMPGHWANLLIAFYFGPIYHNRYLFGGDYLTLAIVFGFGLLAGWLTLRRRNVAGAVIGHTAMNFLIFLFIGGKVSSL
jgi:membrane protease YdiL (CAAX protease family)